MFREIPKTGLGLLLTSPALTGLASLVFADEENITLPSSEEIKELLLKSPREILQLAIKEGSIKEFVYTRQTTPNDFYKFLNKFDNQRVFGFIYPDKLTYEKTDWTEGVGTGDERIGSASAIVFLYLNKNLKGKDIGFFFLELKDFYGEENWRKFRKIFNIKGISIPSLAEYVRKEGEYKLIEIGSCGLFPEDIHKYIKLNVEEYSKK